MIDSAVSKKWCTGAWCLGFILGVILCVTRVFGQASMRINEISLQSLTGQAQWIELYNATAAVRNIDGFILTDGDGNNYEVPILLPPVPGNAFVLVHFDGRGASFDDYDFTDNVANLHSEADLVDPFDPNGDQAALYESDSLSSESIQSYVSWVVADDQTTEHAVKARIWAGRTVIVPISGTPKSTKGPSYQQEPGGSLGLIGNPQTADHRSWTTYRASETSPGVLNQLPAPAVYLPQDKTQYDHGSFNFSWIRIIQADRYQIQICTDQNCTNPILDDSTLIEPHFRPVDSLPVDAVYYWRVRAYDSNENPGPWTNPFELTIGYPSLSSAPAKAVAKSPAREGPFENYTLSGTVYDAVSNRGLEGAVVVLWLVGFPPDFYLTALTGPQGEWEISDIMDVGFRIRAELENYQPVEAFTEFFQDANDVNFWLLGHSDMLNVYPLAARKDTKLLCLDGCEETNANNRHWNGSHEALVKFWDHESHYCPYTAIKMINNYYAGTITRDELAWHVKAVDNQPIDDLSHATGCVDPETTKGLRWAMQTVDAKLYYSRVRPTDNQLIDWIQSGRPLMYSTDVHWMVVDGYRYVNKKVEARFLNTDNDKDGIVNFDEVKRFESNPDRSDTDRDWLNDFAEVLNYTFHRFYHPLHQNFYPVHLYDIDGDGRRTETDRDADNDGDLDRGEDLNGNGHNPDAGETCMFDAKDFVLLIDCPDLNHNGEIDAADFAFLAQFWGQNEPAIDIFPPPNGNGIIDILDLAALFDKWLEKCQ